MTQPWTDTDVDLVARTLAGDYWRTAVDDARAVLSALAAAGRLTPEPTEIRTEWGVWWHGPIGDGIRLTQDKFTSRQAAEQHAPTRIGDYGITRWTLHRREHRIYPDHSSWSGPWLPVPAEPAPLDDRLGDTWASPVTATGFDTEEDTDAT